MSIIDLYIMWTCFIYEYTWMYMYMFTISIIAAGQKLSSYWLLITLKIEYVIMIWRELLKKKKKTLPMSSFLGEVGENFSLH